MNKINRVVLSAGFGAVLALASLVGAGIAGAHEFTAGAVTVAHPWARATPGGVSTGGAYLELKAAPGRGDRLVGARTPAAAAVELHSHVMESGIARMRRVDAIAVPGGKSVVLAPGGYHLMLTGLTGPLKEGDLLKLTLVFEKAGELEVEASVKPVGATGPHGLDRQPGQAVEKPSQHRH